MLNIKVFAKKVGQERADNEKEYQSHVDKLQTEISNLKSKLETTGAKPKQTPRQIMRKISIEKSFKYIESSKKNLRKKSSKKSKDLTKKQPKSSIKKYKAPPFFEQIEEVPLVVQTPKSFDIKENPEVIIKSNNFQRVRLNNRSRKNYMMLPGPSPKSKIIRGISPSHKGKHFLKSKFNKQLKQLENITKAQNKKKLDYTQKRYSLK